LVDVASEPVVRQPILGLVWAAWHLVPVALQVGLFPYLEAADRGVYGLVSDRP
jgi:hypothetical protein